MQLRKIALIAAIIILLFVIFFWPGLYHYDKMSWGPLTYPIRINRITGHVQTNIDNEWTDGVGPQIKDSKEPSQVTEAPSQQGWRELSPQEVKALEKKSK